ncbi:MAG: DUF2384 domain-containing protein [Spirochaetales bacterium]|nr:DUF2384 domain-containing protein [Spirochaetales bacterium]
MEAAETVPIYLGLSKSVRIRNEMDLITIIRNRLSRNNFDFVRGELKMSLKEFSNTLRISEKTIQRYKRDELLNENVTEGLIEIAEIIAMGVEVLGNKSEFLDWFHSPVISLGSNKPVSLLDTHHGRKLILNELGRIEHGIYA